MYPLSGVATGFLLIGLDFRINQFDVLLDPVGWILVIVGLRRLTRSVDSGFQAPWLASITAGLLSLTDVIGPANVVLNVLYVILLLVAAWLIATAVMRRAGEAGDTAMARAFDRLRWALLVPELLGFVAYAVGAGMAIILLVVLVGLGVYIWFIVLMYRAAKRPYLVVPDAAPSGDTGWL